MRQADIATIHEAMEQQTISVGHRTLKSVSSCHIPNKDCRPLSLK